jgi:hypothetical protein
VADRRRSGRGARRPPLRVARQGDRPGPRPLPREPLAVRVRDAQVRPPGDLPADREDGEAGPARAARADPAGVGLARARGRPGHPRALRLFATQQARVVKRALPVGDYGVEVGGEVVAAVERKSLQDLAGRLVDGNLAFAMAELSSLPNAAVVIGPGTQTCSPSSTSSPASSPTSSRSCRCATPTCRSCSPAAASTPRSGPSDSSARRRRARRRRPAAARRVKPAALGRTS